jgi:AcrR family transcriptional regulator
VRTTGARAKVERAALELFAVKGFDGVSIAEIATAAGVAQGALYRHYPSKQDLAWALFSEAYRHTGAELDAIRAARAGFDDRVAAMVAHVCALYDTDPALFRFMLLTQHDLLPRLEAGERTPVTVIEDVVRDAVAAGAIAPVDPSSAAAAILGVVLQNSVFHVYGRLRGSLSGRAAGLAAAAGAAVRALAAAGGAHRCAPRTRRATARRQSKQKERAT